MNDTIGNQQMIGGRRALNWKYPSSTVGGEGILGGPDEAPQVAGCMDCIFKLSYNARFLHIRWDRHSWERTITDLFWESTGAIC